MGLHGFWLACFALIASASNGNVKCYPFAVNSSTRVLILGSGMAGIGVAEGLMNGGFNNFLLLEGRNRVGGRIQNAKFGNTMVSLGAGWIHNTGPDNPIWKMALKYNISYHVDDYFDIIVRNGNTGKVIPGGQKEEYKLKKYIEKAMELGTKRAKGKKGNPPFLATLAMAGWQARSLLEKAIQYFMLDFENGIGAELCSSTVVGYTGEGKDVVVTDPRGYDIVPEILSKPFADRIHFEKVVTSVDHTGPTIEVTTRDGTLYHAEYVVVTFSSGVMNSGNIKFIPPLPDWKSNAYAVVPMSHYCKFFLQFPHNFWDNKNYILLAHHLKGHFVHFQSFDRPTLAPGRHILLATVTGEKCKDSEALPEREFVRDVMVKLRKVYGQSIPNPIAVLRSNWSNDEFTLGSYSNPSPGTEDTLYDNLQEPVDKRVWFAGEATAGSEHYGYVHGAYIGGHEQAKKLLTCMETGRCSGTT